MPRAGGHEDHYREKRRQALQWFAAHCDWLQEDAPIPRELAEGLVRSSAWWIDHPSGPVEAPGDANHVTRGPYGWRIYSGNSFEISLFIKSARRLIRDAYDAAIRDRPIPPGRLKEDIAIHGVRCVSDYQDDLYRFYGSLEWIPCGNHAIDTFEAAQYLIDQSRYAKAVAYKPRLRRQADATADQKRDSGAPKRVADPSPSTPQPRRRARRKKKNRSAPQLTDEQRQWVNARLTHLQARFGSLSQQETNELTDLLTRLAPLTHSEDLTTQQRQRLTLLKGAVVAYAQRMEAKRRGDEAPAAPPKR